MVDGKFFDTHEAVLFFGFWSVLPALLSIALVLNGRFSGEQNRGTMMPFWTLIGIASIITISYFESKYRAEGLWGIVRNYAFATFSASVFVGVMIGAAAISAMEWLNRKRMFRSSN